MVLCDSMKRILLPLAFAILIVGGISMVNSNQDDRRADKLSDNYVGNYQVDESGFPTESKTDVIGDNQNIMKATLQTNKGNITIEFNPNTPNTVANFVKLAQSGFYDGTKFHRVIAGFMNQGGDPLSKDDSKMAYWGTGGPGYTFADEIKSDNNNAVGTLSMANAGPNTNGSQFFINVADNNFLDPKHTVFGKVTAGMDVVMAINKVKTGVNDRPVDPVVIQKVVLE